jgi:hypothetical protein
MVRSRQRRALDLERTFDHTIVPYRYSISAAAGRAVGSTSALCGVLPICIRTSHGPVTSAPAAKAHRQRSNGNYVVGLTEGAVIGYHAQTTHLVAWQIGVSCGDS